MDIVLIIPTLAGISCSDHLKIENIITDNYIKARHWAGISGLPSYMIDNIGYAVTFAKRQTNKWEKNTEYYIPNELLIEEPTIENSSVVVVCHEIGTNDTLHSYADLNGMPLRSIPSSYTPFDKDGKKVVYDSYPKFTTEEEFYSLKRGKNNTIKVEKISVTLDIDSGVITFFVVKKDEYARTKIPIDLRYCAKKLIESETSLVMAEISR